jgi:hypothetical protein
MSNFKLLTMVLTLKEDKSHASISSVFYEFYDDINDLKQDYSLKTGKFNAL